MNKVLLAVDMDDTLCDTQSEINKRLHQSLYDMGMLEHLKDVHRWSELNKKNKRFSTLYYPNPMRAIINENIVPNGEYTSTVQPTRLVLDGELKRTIVKLKTVLGDNFKPVIATHRHKENQVKENTLGWLDAQHLSSSFEDVHFIYSEEHPNKIEYLKKLYPGYLILLLDDNPFGNPNGPHDTNESVLVYQELSIYPGYINQNKFTTVQDLELQLLDLSRFCWGG